LKKGLRLLAELGSREGAADSLDELALVVARQGRPERAALVLGSAEAMRESVGITPTPLDRDWRQGVVSAVRSLMTPEAYAVAVARGRANDFEHEGQHSRVVTDALEKSMPPSLNSLVVSASRGKARWLGRRNTG